MEEINNHENLIVKNIFKNSGFYILLPLILSLLFFTLVGMAEKSSLENVLRDPTAILGISLSVLCAISSFYSSVLLNNYVVGKFIGSCREIIYTYSVPKEKILFIKVNSFTNHYIKSFIMHVVVGEILYFCFYTIMFGNPPFYSLYQGVFVLLICVLCLQNSLLIIYISIAIGIVFKSTNLTLSTAVILICTLGNCSVYAYNLKIEILFIIIIVLTLMCRLVELCLMKYIKQDHLMS